jgi:16S rRNA (guanine527-N7)-methyltransferase
MENLLEKYNVSRETTENLVTFQNMVLEWNEKFNLISKSSVEDIWERHVLDSAQLIQYIKNEDKTLYDFGSGAGFPAVVLAIISRELYPNLKITLIESIGKKATFLSEVNKKLKLNMVVLPERIEKLTLPKADIITSRAMASLEKLLQYAKPFCNKETKLLFLKGEKWQEEIKTAEQKWTFEHQSFSSETSEKGRVLLIKNIRRNING